MSSFTDIPTSAPSQNTVMYTFEDGWDNFVQNDLDDFDWTRMSGSTSPVATRPSSGHGNSRNAPVTLGSDYRPFLKTDPILLILKSELDVPILKIDKFAVTLLLFIETILLLEKRVNDLSYDYLVIVVR